MPTLVADQKTISVTLSAPDPEPAFEPRAALSPPAARRLARRRSLALDPRRAFAIKRNVHEVVVDAEPEALGAALARVLEDPRELFGAIRVKRPADRVGRPFAPGERFSGTVVIDRLIADAVHRGGVRGLGARLVRACLRLPGGRGLTGWIEETLLSDYAELVELRTAPDPATGAAPGFRYVYLSGSPIRGASSYAVEREPEGGSRVVQTFTYQEVSGFAISAVHRFGIRQHDLAVRGQVERAAARLGARVVSTTIRSA